MRVSQFEIPNSQTADALLFDAIPTVTNDQDDVISWYMRKRYQNTDVIGIIYEGGEWDAEGIMISPPVPLEGWHVNVRLMPDEDGAPLDVYKVFPSSPRRVWA